MIHDSVTVQTFTGQPLPERLVLSLQMGTTQINGLVVDNPSNCTVAVFVGTQTVGTLATYSVPPQSSKALPIAGAKYVVCSFQGVPNDSAIYFYWTDQTVLALSSTLTVSSGSDLNAENGYAFFLGGAMIQWQDVKNVPCDGSALVAVTFTKAFGTVAFQAFALPSFSTAQFVALTVSESQGSLSPTGVSYLVGGAPPGSLCTLRVWSIGI